MKQLITLSLFVFALQPTFAQQQQQQLSETERQARVAELARGYEGTWIGWLLINHDKPQVIKDVATCSQTNSMMSISMNMAIEMATEQIRGELNNNSKKVRRMKKALERQYGQLPSNWQDLIIQSVQQAIREEIQQRQATECASEIQSARAAGITEAQISEALAAGQLPLTRQQQ